MKTVAGNDVVRWELRGGWQGQQLIRKNIKQKQRGKNVRELERLKEIIADASTCAVNDPGAIRAGTFSASVKEFAEQTRTTAVMCGIR